MRHFFKQLEAEEAPVWASKFRNFAVIVIVGLIIIGFVQSCTQKSKLKIEIIDVEDGEEDTNILPAMRL